MEIKRQDNKFVFTVTSKISKEEAMKLQKEAGYDPGGYDFFNFKYDATKKVTRWMCFKCCD